MRVCCKLLMHPCLWASLHKCHGFGVLSSFCLLVYDYYYIDSGHLQEMFKLS